MARSKVIVLSQLQTAMTGMCTANDARFRKLSVAITESDLGTELATKINGKADQATTLAGYSIGDAYTKTEVDNLVAANLTSAYKAAGSLAPSGIVAGLLTAANEGKVYNVTGSFTTTSALFVDYVANNTYPAGTNIVVVEATPADNTDPENPVAATYKFDVLAGFVDLSPYALNQVAIATGTEGARNGLVTADDKKILDEFGYATDSEVESLVSGLYSA